MSRLLHLTASPRGTASFSSRISTEFVNAWLEDHPKDQVITRDIGLDGIPLLDAETIAAFYTAARDRTSEQLKLTRFSDTLVDELRSSDVYVLSMPMYNFSVPAVFKAYIDQIVRIGVTVNSDWEGLLTGKKAIVITSRGGLGYGVGEVREAYNFEDGYLRTVLNLIGVTDQTYIHVPGTAYMDVVERSLSMARARIREVIGEARLTQNASQASTP